MSRNHHLPTAFEDLGALDTLRGFMPRTMREVELFLADPARAARVPRSSESGRQANPWPDGVVDARGRPAGTLLALGGVCDRVFERTATFFQGLTSDQLVERAFRTGRTTPRDDFGIVVERWPNRPLTLHIDCLTHVPGLLSKDRNVRTLGIGVGDLDDAQAAELVRIALEARFKGLAPRDLLVQVRDKVLEWGGHRTERGWTAAPGVGLEARGDFDRNWSGKTIDLDAEVIDVTPVPAFA